MESPPELPLNLNIVTLTLTLTLWPINSGVLTSLRLPHLSSSLTYPLPSLNHSKTDAWFMQDAPKAAWSIPYVSAAFFPTLKHNFIAYRSSKVSDCIFEIHQQWQPGFSRVRSNYWSSCSFEPEIIKIGQSSHKMYSNKMLNFQEFTTIINACKKSLETYWMTHIHLRYLSIYLSIYWCVCVYIWVCTMIEQWIIHIRIDGILFAVIMVKSQILWLLSLNEVS